MFVGKIIGHLDPITPSPFCSIKSCIRDSHYVLVVLCFRGRGRTHADRSRLSKLAQSRLIYGCSNLFRSFPGLFSIAARQNNQELFATIATDGVIDPYRRSHPSGDLLQNNISLCVAETVIYLLEVVHIDENYTDRPVFTQTTRQFPLQNIDYCRTVEQTR